MDTFHISYVLDITHHCSFLVSFLDTMKIIHQAHGAKVQGSAGEGVLGATVEGPGRGFTRAHSRDTGVF